MDVNDHAPLQAGSISESSTTTACQQQCDNQQQQQLKDSQRNDADVVDGQQYEEKPADG